jgi:L-fuconolactonase
VIHRSAAGGWGGPGTGGGGADRPHPPIVDTHVHVVAADQDRYPLHPAAAEHEWLREPPVTAERYLSLMGDAGVEAAVLVQAFSAYGTDNRYVVDAAADHRDQCTSVVIVAGDDDGAAELRRLVAEHGVSGVRFFAIGTPSLARLDDAETLPVWEVAAELGLVVVATILPTGLRELDVMLDRFPDLPVALDHCGFPDLRDGPPYNRADALFALADRRNLHLKVSCYILERLVEDGGDPGDLVGRLAVVFGADRLLWGSDFPQTHDRPYAALVELGRRACAGLDADDQRRFLGENALRLWPQLGAIARR